MPRGSRQKVLVKIQKPPAPAHLAPEQVEAFLNQVRQFLDRAPSLTGIWRVDLKRGRLYFVYLEQHHTAGHPELQTHLLKPLIVGRYYEEFYSRITFWDGAGTHCTLDREVGRPGNWMTEFEGNLHACLTFLAGPGCYMSLARNVPFKEHALKILKLTTPDK